MKGRFIVTDGGVVFICDTMVREDARVLVRELWRTDAACQLMEIRGVPPQIVFPFVRKAASTQDMIAKLLAVHRSTHPRHSVCGEPLLNRHARIDENGRFFVTDECHECGRFVYKMYEKREVDLALGVVLGKG